MKGKIKTFNRILLIMLALLTSAVCFSVSINEKVEQQKYRVASTLYTTKGNEKFSAKTSGDVLLSVEKVLMDSAIFDPIPDYTLDGESKKTFYERTDSDVGGEVREFYDYYYNTTKEKYVVDNGEFVMLENDFKNNKYTTTNNENLTEAIVFSFGQYIIVDNEETISTAEKYVEDVKENPLTAKVESLNITMKHNSNSPVIKGARNIVADGGPYYDFMMIIEQKEGNQGYYRFDIDYKVGGIPYSTSFEFYLLFKTDYNESVKLNGNDYYKNPTLGWEEPSKGFESAEKDSTGYSRYYIGRSGINGDEISYPTITYDYTKYKFTYTHTYNDYDTTYKFNYSYNNNEGYLNYEVDSPYVDKTVNYQLQHVNKKLDGYGDTKLVTIMLTDPGAYKFEFEYIYTGYNSSNDIPMNLDVYEISPLYIHGYDLLYSKHNYNSAEFRHLQIAAVDKVDLIIPNGYEIDSDISGLINTDLGFSYSLVTEKEDTTARNGNVLSNETQDTLINSTSAYSTLLTSSDKTELTSALASVNYQKTNQASIWVSRTKDKYEDEDVSTKDSFYYHSNKRITYEDFVNPDKKVAVTSITTFNEVGYYLLFMKVIPAGVSDANKTYYQIFAFEYSTDPVTITVKEESGEKVVGAGGYTKDDVKVEWTVPGIFERKLTAYYYKTVRASATTDDMLQTTAYPLTREDAILGSNGSSNVAKGSFVKFLIEVRSEGDAATHKVFTIDRQDISGVGTYLIQKNMVGSNFYYSYALNEYQNTIEIANGITDSFATLSWANKQSGAQIKATYSRTTFISSGQTGKLLDNGYMLNNYTLGTTISGTNINRAESTSYVDENDVLYLQGIYVFTLTDEAGNSCKYMLIIDNTKSNFLVDNTIYKSGASLIFGDTVSFNVGSHKAMDLNLAGNENINEEVKSLITAFATNGNVRDLNYYSKGNNITSLYNLFNNYKNSGEEEKTYLTVKNEAVYSYNQNDDETENYSTSGNINYDSKQSSKVRKLYVKSANSTYSSIVRNNKDLITNITIEINTDNSMLTVYYSSATMDGEEMPTMGQDGKEGTNIYRLYTNNGEIGEAQATSETYVSFVWNIGVDDYRVKEVKYSFYELDVSTYADNGRYFYQGISEEVLLYSNGSFVNKQAKKLTDGRGFAQFGDQQQSPAGLYVITRTYEGELPAGSKDARVLSYYFIIDRNKIIDNGVGANISIEIMQENNYDNFSKIITNKNDKGTINVDGIVLNYNVYLSTTKVPTTLRIPTGKYFDGRNSSGVYNAGELKVKVYYIDEYEQINKKVQNQGIAPVMIFNSDDDNFALQQKDGYYIFDIYSYLADKNKNMQSKLTMQGKEWIYLPGTYVIVLQDNVLSTANRDKLAGNSLTFAFRITKGNNPTIDVETGYNKSELVTQTVDSSTADNYNYSLITSDEFVAFDLPKLDNSSTTTPQVDKNYLVVKKYFNGSESSYIDYKYGYLSGYSLETSNDFVKQNEDGSRTVYLNTELRDGLGNIIEENLSKPLYYDITIRYRLYSIGSTPYAPSAEYINCYRYYENDQEKIYYETTYRIIIDRQAPTQNLNKLVSNDNIIKEYNNANGCEMFEESYHNSGSKIYFTNQYNAFYNKLQNMSEKDYSLIYALKVNDNTEFVKDDIYKVLYKKIDPSNFNLSLPVISESGYEAKTYNDILNIQTYGNIFNESDYYEVVELDKAGNATQYVVHYSNEPEDDLAIRVNVVKTTGEEESFEFNYTADNSVLNIFGIKEALTTTKSSYFHVIKIAQAGQTQKTILTNFKTDFSKLANEISECLKGLGFGNFNLSLQSRTNFKQTYIGVYNYYEQPELDIEKLIGSNSFNLKGSHFVDTNGIKYYPVKISITYKDKEVSSTKTFEAKNGGEDYTNSTNVPTWTNSDDITFVISVTDIFGRVYNHIFNTQGKELYSIDFAGGSYKHNNIYYSYTDAVIKFDKTLFGNIADEAVKLKLNNGLYEIKSEMFSTVDNYHVLTIAAPYNDETDLGGVDSYVLTLTDVNGMEYIYNFVLDTNIPRVYLRDAFYESKTMEVDINLDGENLETFESTTTVAGVMNLSWERPTNSYFKYKYILKELKRGTEQLLTSNYKAITEGGSYQLIINVYGLDETYLGNKVYAFLIADRNDRPYYIKEMDINNATFNLNKVVESAEDKEYPLYVSNKTLTPIFNEALLIKSEGENKPHDEIVSISTTKYSFVVYQVNALTYTDYFAIMTVFETDKVTNQDIKVKVNNGNDETDYNVLLDSNSFVAVGKYASANVSGAQTYSNSSDYIESLNSLVLEIYYNDHLKPVVVKEFKPTKVGESSPYENKFNYSILGSGYYKFVVKDLAGNIHKYGDVNRQVDNFVVAVHKEVIITINDEAPISNAYYNGEVKLSVYSSTKYDTSSIKVGVKLNGVDYPVTNYNSCKFTKPGTYKVTVEAKLGGVQLQKKLSFTIINENEANESINLTNLSGYKITKVLNNYGTDITETFNTLFNSSNNGLIVSYDDLLQNGLVLNNGKQKYYISYKVQDYDYPTRDVTFAFALNNEKPKIDCSLKAGDTTTKGFNISFNAGIIYDQIGEACLYINDTKIEINALSAYEISTITRTFEEHGAGDYYIKLVSSSGNVLVSYKATIKEPLNFWAIIIIIVVSAVVIGVTVTIIVLRNRMRIR